MPGMKLMDRDIGDNDNDELARVTMRYKCENESQTDLQNQLLTKPK